MEKPPSLEKLKNIETVHTLRDYLAQGFLLHGGKALVDELEPRQSTDENPDRTTGKAYAIYAEAHDVRIPVLMALFAKKDMAQPSWYCGYSAHGPESTLVIRGTNCTFSQGYVYVLPRDTFVREGDEGDFEYISTTPVKPIAVIPITPTILDALDNIENNIE